MTHRDLDVYKESMNFVGKIYELTRRMPKSEVYGLSSQMQRAAVSIPSNIAEGASRKGTKEYIHFLYNALGSASELETQLGLIVILKLLPTDKDISDLLKELDTIRMKLLKMIRSLETKLQQLPPSQH
ncbi:MAG: four helix bundle protein [Candidatus Cloacimonetes bacterium]|nr:four helix bundle protein [Candidatus Cloacimonadota bacterium]